MKRILWGTVAALGLVAIMAQSSCDPEPTPPPPPPPPVVVNLPRLIPGEHVFTQEGSNTPFILIGINDHQMFELWRNNRATFDAVLQQRVDLGFNKSRVFSMCNVKLDPNGPTQPDNFRPCFLDTDYNDAYYAEWKPFLQAFAQKGMYVQVDVFACSMSLMPDFDQRQRHWVHMVEAMRGSTNVMLTLGNELDNACNQIDPERYPAPEEEGLLWGWGSNSSQAAPPRPYGTWGRFESFHVNGAYQWFRKTGHNAMEFNQGDPEGHITPSRVPIVIDESNRPDQDWTPQRLFGAVATAILLAGGFDYHCMECRFSRVLEGVDLEGAQVAVAAARSIPVHCPTDGGYRHRGDLEQPDAGATGQRVYQRGTNDACIAETPQP